MISLALFLFIVSHGAEVEHCTKELLLSLGAYHSCFAVVGGECYCKFVFLFFSSVLFISAFLAIYSALYLVSCLWVTNLCPSASFLCLCVWLRPAFGNDTDTRTSAASGRFLFRIRHSLCSCESPYTFVLLILKFYVPVQSWHGRQAGRQASTEAAAGEELRQALSQLALQ